MRRVMARFLKHEQQASDRVSEVASGPDVWEQWFRYSHYAFYVLLCVSTLLALAPGDTSWERGALAVGVSLLFAVWYWIFLIHASSRYDAAFWFRLIFLAGAFAFFFALVMLYPGYTWLSFIIYWHIWGMGRLRWSVPLVAAFTLLLLWSREPRFTDAGLSEIAIFATTLLLSAIMALFIFSLIDQSEQRKNLIKELEHTREELAAEERRTGILEERSRLAREIHDTLAQGFISIVTHLEAAEEEPPGSESMRRHLGQAKQTGRENLTEARRLVAALRPEILEGYSLPQALQKLAARWSETSGAKAEVSVIEEREQLPQELQVTLFRSAQEALANARKHAGAPLSRVSITLSYTEDLVILDVQDDGVGFVPDLTRNGSGGGYGLAAMRERVERLGGTLMVESAPGEGTTLAVQLPLQLPSRKQAGSSHSVESG